MTVSDRLATLALAAVDDGEADALRTRTLTNVAAGAGDGGSVGRMLAALPLAADRSASEAAYLFAARFHARTQDDFYAAGRVHVGAIVLAAVLAVADAARDRTLASLAAGYRVQCAVSAAYATDAQRRGLRPSGVFGPFGAAAGAAVALGLGREGIANAIGLAAASAGGTNQAWLSGTDEWVLEVGAAARAGVEAALFTQAGARAAADAFEGRAGWAAALFDEPGAERLRTTPAADGAIATVATKPYPISGIAQVPTALACRLHEDGGANRLGRVVVRMSEPELAYPGSANRGPFRSRSDALMSVAFCVACALHDGGVPLSRLEAPNAPDVTALMERIDVVSDAGLADGEAGIEASVGERTIAHRGSAAEILHPSWRELADDGDELARRCETRASLVIAVRDELAVARPDARALRRLVETFT